MKNTGDKISVPIAPSPKTKEQKPSSHEKVLPYSNTVYFSNQGQRTKKHPEKIWLTVCMLLFCCCFFGGGGGGGGGGGLKMNKD